MSNKIPKQKRSPQRQPAGNDKVAIVSASATSFAGPVPHPDILRGYDAIVAGSAERILKMAENEAAHQHKLEDDALAANSSEVKRGQNYGLIVTIAAFATSAFCAAIGATTTASVIGGSTVVCLATAFILGRTKQKQS